MAVTITGISSKTNMYNIKKTIAAARLSPAAALAIKAAAEAPGNFDKKVLDDGIFLYSKTSRPNGLFTYII
jgi:hypothetical protein